MIKVNFTDLSLVSSNARKLEEYVRYGVPNLKVSTGIDLREVDGTPEEVILHKAIAAGDNKIVEDSILVVEGTAFVDARWRIGSVAEWFGKSAVWVVNLGVNANGRIVVFSGEIEGVFGPAKGKGWDYDPFFKVGEERLSLAELELLGRKDEFSARRRAVEKLLAGDAAFDVHIDNVPAWVGGYQHG